MKVNRAYVAVAILISVISSSSVFAAKKKIKETDRIRLLSTRYYNQLSNEKKKKYITELRGLVLNFEKSTNKNLKIVQEGFEFSLLSTAFAAGKWSDTCIIGGVIRRTTNGLCPTSGRECPGQANSFQCGKIYSNVCVSKEPKGNLSERCHAGGTSIPSGQLYEEIKPILEEGLNRACVGGTSNEDSCRLLRSRLTELNNLNLGPPLPLPNPEPLPPPPLPPLPKPDNSQFSVIGADTCAADRDQGQNGSCHAFCMTCTYDQVASKLTNKKSRVSSNWIAMLSVVNRVCDDPQSEGVTSDAVLKEGWWPHQNMELLGKVGACQQEDYLPYSANEGTDWGKQFEAFTTRGLNPKPEFDDPTWAAQFGISGSEAYDLFCPTPGVTIRETLNDRAAYKERLESLKVKRPQFYKCAKKAIDQAEKLNPTASSSSCTKVVSNGNKVDQLKSALKNENRPIPIVIQTDVAGHDFHCVTVTGWDDKTGEFKLTNSWGATTKYTSLKFNDIERLRDMTLPSCAFGSSKGASSASGSSDDKGTQSEGGK